MTQSWIDSQIGPRGYDPYNHGVFSKPSDPAFWLAKEFLSPDELCDWLFKDMRAWLLDKAK